MHAIALPLTVADIVDEFAMKTAAVDSEIEALKAAVDRMKFGSVIQGVYVDSVFSDPYVRPDHVRLNLRKSGWKAVYSRLQIDRLASAKDRRLFEQTLTNPPDLTLENAKATFGDYLLRPRFHQLRGLAECFAQLDPAYKSHAKVKIGVAGLPKRVILSGVGGYGSWGRDRLRDILNALAAMQGLALVDHAEFKALDKLTGVMGTRAGDVSFDGAEITRYQDGRDEPWTPPNRGVKVKIFQNGNGHVIFEPDTLITINRALAEFYGEVLPDAEGDDVAPRPGTGLSSDLQYYPTPAAVIDEILDKVGLYKPNEYAKVSPMRVLEPSCGDGRMLDAIRSRGHLGTGVEVDPGRARQAKAKGHHILTANFLETATRGDFDFVVMNPPFSGKHYRKHIEHARKFLKPEGRIVCILPASAWYDHGGLKGEWHDLPVASFSESGTNIPTGYITMGRD